MEINKEKVEKVSVSLQSVVVIAQKNAELIAKVQSISASQSAAMEHINTGIDQVAHVVQQNRATAKESASSSEEMSAQANSLEDLVYKFRHNNSETADRSLQQKLTKAEYMLTEGCDRS